MCSAEASLRSSGTKCFLMKWQIPIISIINTHSWLSSGVPLPPPSTSQPRCPTSSNPLLTPRLERELSLWLIFRRIYTLFLTLVVRQPLKFRQSPSPRSSKASVALSSGKNATKNKLARLRHCYISSLVGKHLEKLPNSPDYFFFWRENFFIFFKKTVCLNQQTTN